MPLPNSLPNSRLQHWGIHSHMRASRTGYSQGGCSFVISIRTDLRIAPAMINRTNLNCSHQPESIRLMPTANRIVNYTLRSRHPLLYHAAAFPTPTFHNSRSTLTPLLFLASDADAAAFILAIEARRWHHSMLTPLVLWLRSHYHVLFSVLTGGIVASLIENFEWIAKNINR